MTARAIGDVLAGRETKMRRTFQPVRRNSRHAGEREHRIWKPLGGTKDEARRFKFGLIDSARRFEREGKQPGKHNGPLGGIGLEVLHSLLFDFVNWKTGRLDPAIATICEKIRRSRGAVVRALARLKEHGFLDWIRRTEPTDNVGAGPQVRQITNAYGFDIGSLPKRARAFVRNLLGRGPPPDCDSARRAQDQERTEVMLDSLTCEQLARTVIDDDGLAEAAAALGRALDMSASSNPGLNPDSEG